MTQPPVYELQSVSLVQGKSLILQNLNFKVYWGERIAVIGASGAGKSSLLKLLNGAIKPSHGSLKLLGQPVHRLSPRRLRLLQRQIGTIYQQFQLVTDLRVIHNVNAGHLSRWPLWKALLSLLYPLEIQQAQAALEQVGLAEKLLSPTAQLSGGQQQRVAIARLLIQNPSIILADEPVSSLDPRLRQDIMDLLLSLLTNQARLLVTSLHDVSLAKQYCDRILGLKAGQLAFDLPSDTVTPEHLANLYETTSPTFMAESLAAKSLRHPHDSSY